MVSHGLLLMFAQQLLTSYLLLLPAQLWSVFAEFCLWGILASSGVVCGPLLLMALFSSVGAACGATDAGSPAFFELTAVSA